MATSTELAITEDIQLENELSNSGYTTEWVLKMLHENNPEFKKALGSNKIKEINAKDISDGKGFLSRVFRVVVTFTDSNEYSFIMKVPTFDCIEEFFKAMGIDEAGMQGFKKKLEKTHNNECDAYNMLKKIENFPKPGIFYIDYREEGGKLPGTIVMEDLSKKATTIGLIRSLTVEHVKNMAKHYGSFQAQVNADDSWHGKYKGSIHESESSQEDMEKLMDKFVEVRPDLKEPIERLMNVDYLSLALWSLQELPAEYKATTLVHGDAWANNMLIKLNEDGSVSNEILAVIDWQIIFEGNPYFDLARMMANSCDAEVRRACEDEAVDILYDTVSNSSKKPEYTREQAHELYELALVNQTFGAVGAAAFVTMNNLENAPEHVYQAMREKIYLRAKLCLEDGLEIMGKYNLFEKFPKKK